MAEITFQQTSPRGTAVIDTRCVLVDTDGKVWICSGSPSNHGLTPASDEQRAVLRKHFGGRLDDAIDAVKALG